MLAILAAILDFAIGVQSYKSQTAAIAREAYLTLLSSPNEQPTL
ncbi:hypothetical protein VCHA40O231_110031 [Vibrio chagasii]|nr:hypothetical protein VCHA40O231_110031 [Vibrio chagasii]